MYVLLHRVLGHLSDGGRVPAVAHAGSERTLLQLQPRRPVLDREGRLRAHRRTRRCDKVQYPEVRGHGVLRDPGVYVPAVVVGELQMWVPGHYRIRSGS